MSPPTVHQRQHHCNRRNKLSFCLLFSSLGCASSSHAHASFVLRRGAQVQRMNLNRNKPPIQRYNHGNYHAADYESPLKLGMMAPVSFLTSSVARYPSKNTLTAAITLLVTAGTGYALPSSSGILVTLALASMASNLGLAPTSHCLYDACWATFLPASLALLLLSANNEHSKTSQAWGNSVKSEIKKVSIPFFIGSVGSIFGCCVAFALVKVPNAALAAGCLCASYIGGSVNFFATAHALRQTASNSVMLSAMAAADLVVMALYFIFLTSCVDSERLKGWLVARGKNADIREKKNASYDAPPKDKRKKSMTSFEKTVAVSLAGGMALSIVQIAKRFEAIVAPIVPGTACAVISALSVAISKQIPQHNPMWKTTQLVAKRMSDFSFHLLFAAIGTCANLVETFKHGPVCLVFSLLALLVHVAVVLSGSIFVSRVGSLNLQLKHVLVASNAAIGGPATAAAFCGQFKEQDQQGGGLVMAGTIWGVVGYAMGTAIGVTLTRVLQRL